MSVNRTHLLIAGIIIIVGIGVLPAVVLLTGGRMGTSPSVTEALPPTPPSPADSADTAITSSQSEGENISVDAAADPESAPPSDAPPPTVMLMPTVAPASRPTDVPPQSFLEHTHDGPGATASIDLPPGVYWVSLHADASFDAVKPIVDEGDCNEYPFFVDTSGPFEGSALYRSTGCRVHFEVGDIDGSWSLDVETPDSRGVLSVPATFDGDQPTSSEPVDLPEGEYHLVLKTDSPYSMVTPIVVDGRCIERPVFMLTEPGEFETTYLSRGCQVVFQVSDVTSDWELSILPGG